MLLPLTRASQRESSGEVTRMGVSSFPYGVGSIPNTQPARELVRYARMHGERLNFKVMGDYPDGEPWIMIENPSWSGV